MSIHGHLNLWSLHPAVHPSHLYPSASLICIHHSLPPYCHNDPSFSHKVSLLTLLQDNMWATLLVSMIILALVFQSSVNTSWSGRASHHFTPKTPQNALVFRSPPLCLCSLHPPHPQNHPPNSHSSCLATFSPTPTLQSEQDIVQLWAPASALICHRSHGYFTGTQSLNTKQAMVAKKKDTRLNKS